MKYFFTTIISMAIALASLAQQVAVEGYVFDLAGNPVPNAVVTVSGIQPIVYIGTLTTDANGYFMDSVPANITQGAFEFSVMDCNGTMQTAIGSFTIFNPVISVTIQICVGSNPAGPVRYALTGFATKQNGPVQSGTAYLIQYDNNTGELTALDSALITPGTQGSYSFANLDSGEYLIKVALGMNDPDYCCYIPTYLGNALYWSFAQTIDVTALSGQPSINTLPNVNLIAGLNPGGPGFVGGNVSQGANKGPGPGDPIAGAQVILITDAGDAVAFTYTDANGDFSFSNLAHGNYKVRVEIVGLSSEEYMVDLNSNNEMDDNANFEVNTTGIVLAPITNGIAPVQEVAWSMEVFPTVSSQNPTVRVNVNRKEDLQVRVISLNGQTVANQQFVLNQGRHNLNIELDEVPAGVYLIQLQSNNTLQTQKFVKVK